MNLSGRVITSIAVICMLVAVANFATAPRRAYALDFGDLGKKILVGGGIAFLVKEFAGDINKGINKIMMKKGVMPEARTKVVPIIRIGTHDKTAVGAVQVVGPPSRVKAIEGVAEGTMHFGDVQGRALLPVTTKPPYTSSVRSVGGVGISANIKFNL